MKNEVKKKNNAAVGNSNAEEETNLNTQANANDADYSTIIEKSMEYNNQTETFDLYKGFIYMFISCFLKSIFSILCKLEMDRNFQITSFHLLTFKAYFMLAIAVLIGLYYLFMMLNKREFTNIYLFHKSKLILIIIRSLLSVLSISLVTFALKSLSVSEVYSVFYVYPGIVILLSCLILKEKVGGFDYICLISCFLGALLVIRPEIIIPHETTPTKPHLFIFILVIIGAALKAGEDIIIRNVGKEINCMITPSIYAVVAVVFYPVTLLFSVNNKDFMPQMDKTDFFIMFLIALFSFAYQMLMSLAIQSENAGRVAMVNYFQVFFMFMSDMFIFHKEMIFLDIVGTFLICFFNLVNGVRKAVKRNDELNYFRSKNCVKFYPKYI